MVDVENFDLNEMVDVALPPPAEPEPQVKTGGFSRRAFLGKASKATLATQFLPSLLKTLMTGGETPVPKGVEKAVEALPENHPLRLITKLAKQMNNLGLDHWKEEEDAFGKNFAIIENPDSREAFIKKKKAEEAQTYHDYTAIEKELLANRAAVESFVDDNYDTIAAMPEFEFTNIRRRLVLDEGDIGKFAEERIADQPLLFERSCHAYAERLKAAREALGVTDTTFNPFEKAKGKVDGTQMLVDRYCQYRQQTYNHLNAFKRFVWEQKNRQPLEDAVNVEEKMESHMEAASKAYDEAVKMAEKLVERKAIYHIAAIAGKVGYDEKIYGFRPAFADELHNLGKDDSQQVIDTLQDEKEHLREQYEEAAKDTILRWKMVDILKDPATHIDHSNAQFIITRLDDEAPEKNSMEAKQEKLDELDEIITTISPDTNTTKTENGMLFIDRTDPKRRRNRPSDELEVAIETIQQRKEKLQQQESKGI